MELLKQRRFWVALTPVLVMAANAAGIEITDTMLQETGDKIVVAAMSLLSLWSYFQPKPAA